MILNLTYSPADTSPSYIYDGTTVKNMAGISGKVLSYVSGSNWELAFIATGSHTLIFQNIATSIDIFCVGGGINGGLPPSSNVDISIQGGSGGKGAKYAGGTVTFSDNTSYTLTVGSANGGTSSFGGIASSSGTTQASGGVGAWVSVSYGNSAAGNGGDGVLAFTNVTTTTTKDTSISSLKGKKFGAGGGGAGAYISDSIWLPGGTGGTTGGGNDGNAATFYGGGGGGSGSSSAKAGYQGIIIIRNHRS